MKYYTYISDAKVEMLLAQAPHELKKKISTEIGFDWKLLKASRKSEVEGEDNRIIRLEIVTAFIREYCNVGSIDSPGEYFEGALPMHSCPFRGALDDIVYFGGHTKKTVVGLAGSPLHMIGATSRDLRFIFGGSHIWAIAEYLEHVLQDNSSLSGEFSSSDDPPILLAGASELALSVRGPVQRLEFLAKRLQFGTIDLGRWIDHERIRGKRCVKQVVLGTPLYVAMAD